MTMTWLEFIVAVTSALAWPSVCVAAVWFITRTGKGEK
jgi:hypothetical protein